MIPQLRCARCGAVFPDPEPERPAGAEREVVCPACGHRGPPGGRMRPSAPPDAASFRRSVAATLRDVARGRSGADGDPADGEER